MLKRLIFITTLLFLLTLNYAFSLQNAVYEVKLNESCKDENTMKYYSEWTDCYETSYDENCTVANHTQEILCPNGCEAGKCSPKSWEQNIIIIVVFIVIAIVFAWLWKR